MSTTKRIALAAFLGALPSLRQGIFGDLIS